MILGELSFTEMTWGLYDGEVTIKSRPGMKAKVKILKVQDPQTEMVVNICFSPTDIEVLKKELMGIE